MALIYKRVHAALLLGALVAGLAVIPGHAAEPSTVPAPFVAAASGGIKGHAFNSWPDAVSGYREDEFLFDGSARAFDLSPVGLASAGDASALPTAPYRTRMIVRRPTAPAKFNGTVVLEWLNVTSGYDFEASFVQVKDEVYRDGYAWVGITAQEVGAAALKAYDPVRYAGVVHPGDQYSYDIFSQAAKSLRVQNGARPLGDLHVQRVLAMGESQSGITLTTYINDVAPKVEPVIDGFAPDTASGEITNTDAKVLRIVTEFEGTGSTQPDSASYRQWDIAGASHSDKRGGEYVQQTQDRDFSVPPGEHWPLAPNDTPSPTGTCLMGRFPRHLANHAALVALDRWVKDGILPPSGPRLGANPDGSVARDSDGNATGGIRLPAIVAPTATYHGEQSNECQFTLGRTDPWSAQMLRDRYTSHAHYVELVTAAAGQAVTDGFLLPVDRKIVVAQARSSDIAA
jgi:hypothetical protein